MLNVRAYAILYATNGSFPHRIRAANRVPVRLAFANTHPAVPLFIKL